MTVSYTAEIATCGKFGFLKLLFRWRGSVYKLVWMDLLLFMVLYYTLNCLYRFAFNEPTKRVFEGFAHYCKSYGTLIPLSFVLGFYVSIVMQRWWEQYMTIPWPDPLAVFVSVHLHGQDERGRMMRRTVMRYVCLCLTITFTLISPRVKKRFPTLSHLVEAGLLLENEKVVMEDLDVAFPKYPKHWMPIVWAASIVIRARKEGRIRDDFAVKTIIDGLNRFRGSCGVLMYFDSISVPLVYTQVVTLAVYTYFLCSVMSYQWTETMSDGYVNYIDCYFPIFSMLQFFFYMGWLKVAESLINPFGEDDDDFEVNWMIDRNLQLSYLIVDEMHHDHPELVRDQYWDEVFPNELPYEADIKRDNPPESSTAKILRTGSQSQANLRFIRSSNVSNAASNAPSRTIISDEVLDHLWHPLAKRLSRTNNQDTSKQSSDTSVWSQAREPTHKASGIVRIKEDAISSGDERRPVPEQQPDLPGTDELDQQTQRSSKGGSVSSTRNVSIKSTEDDDDDFERLRKQRERERAERRRQRFAKRLAELPQRLAQSDMSRETSQPTSHAPSSTQLGSVPTSSEQQRSKDTDKDKQPKP